MATDYVTYNPNRTPPLFEPHDSGATARARVAFSNTDYTIVATADTVIAQTGTLSASRTVTLPAASAVTAGTEFLIVDQSGTVTATNTLVITRAGSDTVNGGTTETIASAYGWRRLVSDGTSAWSFDGGITRLTATQTLSNKRLTPRVTSITSSATPTINTDNCDAVTITAQAAAVTSFTTNLTGTPSNFDRLLIRIKDDGTARAITWGASFASRGATLPTTTVVSKVLTVGFLYNSVAAVWDCVASAQEA